MLRIGIGDHLLFTPPDPASHLTHIHIHTHTHTHTHTHSEEQGKEEALEEGGCFS